MYQHESIPSILEPSDTATVLRDTRRDKLAKECRDYAILQLLAANGMRAAQIKRLQLQVVDWHAETLTVTHTKTRSRTILPLMPQVAVVLIGYGSPSPSVGAHPAREDRRPSEGSRLIDRVYSA